MCGRTVTSTEHRRGWHDRGRDVYTVGRVQVVGVRGKVPIEWEFLHRLAELSPTARQLAIAQACVAPWQENPSTAPACYQREHEPAFYLRREEERHTGQAPFNPASVSPSDEPILKGFLLDLVGMTAARRRLHIALACTGPWGSLGDCPDWVKRQLHYARRELHAERTAAADTGSHDEARDS